MRIGPFDGTTEELKNVVENHGFNVGAYLKPPLAIRFIVIPVVIFLLAVGLLGWFQESCPGNVQLLLCILTIAAGTWTCVSVRMRFNSSLVTSIIAIGGIIILLTATRVFSLKDVADYLRGVKK